MEARYEQEEEQTQWMKVRDRFQQRLERWYRQAQRMDTHGHKEESSYGDGRTRWMNIHAHKEEESYPYEQKGEWPRQAQWSGHSPYAGYENLWGKWLNVHGPYGRKQPFVMSLIMKGINFNDLKPDSYRRFDLNCPDDTNSLAEAEHRMREWKLSVEDLKRGTFYSALENGRNLYGEKISKEDGLRMIDQINNDYKNDYKKELNGKMEVDHDDEENVDYSRVKRRSKTKHHKRSKAKHGSCSGWC